MNADVNTRICFVTLEYPPDWGGIATSAQRVVTLLAQAGFEVHVFVPARPGQGQGGAAPSPVAGVHLYRVAIDKASPEGIVLPFVKALFEADLRHRFDLFHGFCLPMAYPCLALPDRGRRPVVASIRGNDATDMLENAAFSDAIRTVLQKASWITSVSSDSLTRAQTVADISGRASFIGNSIAPSSGARWRPDALNRGVVGTVCTFRPKKNVPGLIAAYAQVDAGLRRRLLLVGEGYPGDVATPAAIARALDVHAVGGETEQTGYVDTAAVTQHLLGMNVFALSSLHEGFPNTLLEAASLGVPIVATAVDGVKDVYRDVPGALLVEPDDPVQLARAIEAVLRDPALAQRLSEQSLAVAARFSREREQMAYVALYERLLGRVHA
ncbi:MAG: glycosyltransferase family 4 protein [Rhodocyclaceae bacterium]